MSGGPDRCPRCAGRMEQGFVVDNAHGGARLVSHWVEGPPEKAFWTRTKAPSAAQIPIGTFRCSSCGFLESWARPEFKAK